MFSFFIVFVGAARATCGRWQACGLAGAFAKPLRAGRAATRGSVKKNVITRAVGKNLGRSSLPLVYISADNNIGRVSPR